MQHSSWIAKRLSLASPLNTAAYWAINKSPFEEDEMKLGGRR